jgi:hypothetical protein
MLFLQIVPYTVVLGGCFGSVIVRRAAARAMADRHQGRLPVSAARSLTFRGWRRAARGHVLIGPAWPPSTQCLGVHEDQHAPAKLIQNAFNKSFTGRLNGQSLPEHLFNGLASA